MKLLVGNSESEYSDLRAHIEANLQQVAYSAADVHAPISRQFDLTGGITSVLHR